MTQGKQYCTLHDHTAKSNNRSFTYQSLVTQLLRRVCARAQTAKLKTVFKSTGSVQMIHHRLFARVQCDIARYERDKHQTRQQIIQIRLFCMTKDKTEITCDKRVPASIPSS